MAIQEEGFVQLFIVYFEYVVYARLLMSVFMDVGANFEIQLSQFIVNVSLKSNFISW